MQTLPKEIQNKIALYALPVPLPKNCLTSLKENRKNMTSHNVLKTINKQVKKFNYEKDKREKHRQMLELMIFLDAYFEYTQISSQMNSTTKMRVKVLIKSMCNRLLVELESLVDPCNTLIILMKKHT